MQFEDDGAQLRHRRKEQCAMSRRQVFKVVDYPPCEAGVEYQGRVLRVRKEPRADHFRVALELLDRNQEGRSIEFTLTFPIRPSGLTNSFFQACGLTVAIDAEIDLQEAVGKVVRVSFDLEADGVLRAVSFRPRRSGPAGPGEADSSPDEPLLFTEGQS
jgi:hypothetical protein